MALRGTSVARARLGHSGVMSLWLPDRSLSPTPFQRRIAWDYPKPPPLPGPHWQVRTLQGTPCDGRGHSQRPPWPGKDMLGLTQDSGGACRVRLTGTEDNEA